jgi:hypothetical protein
MAHHTHTPVSLDEQYVFEPKSRTRIYITIGIGLLLLIVGCILAASGVGAHEAAHGAGAEHAEGGHEAFNWTKRLFANLWLDAVFFAGIAVIGLFFVAFNFVAQAGWSSVLQRIPLSFGYFLPIAGVVMLTVFFLAQHDLFHWTHHALFEEKLANGQPNPEFDEIIAKKAFYLNVPFYLIRMVLYFGVWFLMFWLIRKEALREDLEGGVNSYHRNTRNSVIFIIFFAVSSVTAAWDWVMSIDTHWFSTMFGWYMFASWFVTGLATITLIVVNLKKQGYLKIVNSNHLHDLGKFMFAFSIFWTYVWFAQFLLIYYANIPEETIYFVERLHGYGGNYRALFFLNIFLNFVFPFLVLMTRDSKRQMTFLRLVACVIIVGHWLDFYMMIMPGAVGEHGGFGLIEFGLIGVFAGVFMLVVGTTLSKAPLIAKNHPMLEESLHHNI